MLDYFRNRQAIIKQWKLVCPKSNPLPIIITSYERLRYLDRCIWSIKASTVIPHKIYVMDDGSRDEMKKYLAELFKRKIIEDFFWNDAIGTANNFNAGIEASGDSEWVVIANDDMYFHRGWDLVGMNTIIQNSKINFGSLSFYDFTQPKVLQKRHGDWNQVTGTGLGTAFIKREAWKKVGTFRIKKNQRMGYFASPFCASLTKAGYINGQLVPHYATHMDAVACILQERQHFENYIKHRRVHKK
jgi:glycosyltransferase involved in cell wall biosynthesis